ncbi:MAG: hypothetical protein KJ556_20595 [Gammaproteobacteria bacterium]|nr:hypothetical protein [Gammaproteobacteria bacterium]
MSELKAKSLQIGTKEGRVVIGVEGKPFAAFSAPEAAQLAALLIKHACIIASGLNPKMVEEEINRVYGKGDPPSNPSSQ